jgi:hypothetical protein
MRGLSSCDWMDLMDLRMQSLDTSFEFMSYLKIFPRSLIAKADGSGAYIGRMTYDFEHYGRMLYDNETGVALEYRLLLCSGWSIRLTGAGQGLAGLSVFIRAMNYYLFSVLQFDPVSHWSKLSDKDYEFYFERVYFDMGTKQFTIAKEMPVLDTADGVRSVLRAKIRS